MGITTSNSIDNTGGYSYNPWNNNIIYDSSWYNNLSTTTTLKPVYIYPQIKKLNFDVKNRATIVYWDDGTKTVVRCCNDQEFDFESGLAQCYLKKVLGSRSNIEKVLKNGSIY